MRSTIVLLFTACAVVLGCTTDATVPATIPAPPGVEACPGLWDACVELCHPRGVRDFGCWSEVPGIDFNCECLDGTKPPVDGLIVLDGTPVVEGHLTERGEGTGVRDGADRGARGSGLGGAGG